MSYTVLIQEKAQKSLKKLDKGVQSSIAKFISEVLKNADDPRSLRNYKPLKGDDRFCRYRVGDYRLICEINDEKIIIYVLEIGHRKNVYKK
ncbi:MAG: type II toxin-antitoxin system RelE/ParE family toxin [Thermoplasmata archaeon]|nr:type II toxin-antitoxin system RelE/ParE family toxin [Thermoplasmata archaeon]